LLVYLVLTCAVLNTLVLQFDFCELSNIVQFKDMESNAGVIMS
jgi:hypothetical protein